MTGWKDKLALTAQKNRQDIVKAKLSRRDMVRLGLLTAGAGLLVVKAGPQRPLLADARSNGVDGPPKPARHALGAADADPASENPGGPFDPAQMPFGPPGRHHADRRREKAGGPPAVQLQPAMTKGRGGQFPPQKFYDLNMQETTQKFHPSYSPTTVWGFDGQVPGPLIRANYGEPVLVRFQNNLPSVKVPQSFGIAEMTTHLHNAHTPTESDGYPVDFFNSSYDTGPIYSIMKRTSRSPEGSRCSNRSASKISTIPMSMPAMSI